MNAEQVLKSENIFFKNDLIGDIPCAIGYIKKFRWSWIATQMNTFVIIGSTTATIDREAIETFSKNCYGYSLKNNMGWPRGWQAGVASIAILAGENIEPPAIEFCETISKKHWSAFEIPIIHNVLENKTYRFIKNPVWGRIYFPYLATLIDNVTKKL